ncbi:hypothetical protein [Amycolatopsis pigmentata]|uniref:Uncharacterized protein n=1 Tax=Amycolatopsis pigmentata TaxID=450801 RepID=A0ABW5FWT9_9PSEU
MTVRKAVAVGVALLAVGLGSAACRGQAAAPASGPQGTSVSSGSSGADPADPSRELKGIETTLDAIDAEVAGDGAG